MSNRLNQLLLKPLLASTKFFSIWAVLCAIVAYLSPDIFLPIKSYTPELLMFVMFTMGVTLSINDFKRILLRPKAVIVCTLLHYIVMPLTALILAKIFAMQVDLLIGIILVGSVASGTASNVMIYLSKGDVALSVTISSVSTLIGVVVTPLLTLLLVGKSVEVPFLNMLLSIIKIVFIPIVAGLCIHHLFTKKLESLNVFSQ